MDDEKARAIYNSIHKLLDRYNRYLVFMFSVDLDTPEGMIVDFMNDERDTINTFLVEVKSTMN